LENLGLNSRSLIPSRSPVGAAKKSAQLSLHISTKSATLRRLCSAGSRNPASPSFLLVGERRQAVTPTVNDALEISAERISSSVARLTSNSMDELQGLASELQNMQEF
jgi:hypothetical protein